MERKSVLFLLARLYGGNTFSRQVMEAVEGMPHIEPRFVLLDPGDWERYGRKVPALNRLADFWEYKGARKALDDFMKENRGQFDLERSGYQGPTLDELRFALRPGMGGDDKYPAFPGRVTATATPASTSPISSPSASPSPTPSQVTAPWQGPQVPRPPADPLARPANPGPDHPRNRPTSPDFGLDYYGI